MSKRFVYLNYKLKTNKMNRELNIIRKATENGFDIDKQTSFEEIVIACEEYLIGEEIDVVEEQVEVASLGNHGQRVDWSDGKGFGFWSQGEIVDFRAHWFDAPDTKVFHTTVVDTDANVVKMYYLVGETDHNKENV